jgi:single-strand DNA-binding protein
MYLNKAIVCGFITRDPELKSLPSGMKVVSFGIATNRTWKDQSGNKQEATEFHNIVAFGKTAEIVGQYLFKGSLVIVEGRIQTRTWEKDGIKHYRTEIITENIQLGPKSPKTAPERTEAPEAVVDAETGVYRKPTPINENVTGQEKVNVTSKAKVGGTEIEYPIEDINPDDIPF